MRTSLAPRVCRVALTQIAFLALAFLAGNPVGGAVLRVKAGAPGPVHNGASWETALLGIQEAIDASSPTDEVWVAEGTYTGAVTLKAGLSLYGGFAGTEVLRDERDPALHETTIDAGGGLVRWQPYGSGDTGPKVLDGFTLRNGATAGPSYGHLGLAQCIFDGVPLVAEDGGGGVTVARCALRNAYITVQPYSGVLTILETTVSNGEVILSTFGEVSVDYSTFQGGNVTLRGDANGTVTGCVFEACGLAVDGLDGPAEVRNCRFNGTGGIAIQSGGGAVIANNTITGFNIGIKAFPTCTIAGNTIVMTGTALFQLQQNTLIANNIIAFNAGAGANDRSEFRSNCFWGNTDLVEEPAMPSPVGANGNIAADPMLADRLRGDLHIQPLSACRDAGDDSAATGTDIDGQPRVQGSHTDIGADESDGTTWTRDPYVLKVKTTGDDLNDGFTWETALKTVSAAAALSGVGDEAWVAAGRYTDRPDLKGIALYGGFQGNETAREQRDSATFISLLDQGADMHGVGRSTIDGFTVFANVVCDSDGLVMRNTYLRASLIGHMSAGIDVIGCRIVAGGISAPLASWLIVQDCEITDSPARGIETLGDVWVEIRRNRLLRCRGGGIYLHTALHPVLEGNTITDCRAVEGAGIWCGGEGLLAWNNLIARNTAEGKGGGIYVATVSHAIVGNTVVSNAAAFGGGMAIAQGHVVLDRSIANNLVAFNTSGLWRENGPDPVFACNDVFGSVGQDYDGFTNPTGSNGNISVDPLLVDRANWNYHLSAGSPCINAGSNTHAALPADFEGDPRIVSGTVDIGADEYQPAMYSLGDVVRTIRLAAGFETTLTGDIKRLNLVKTGASADCITVEDAQAVARKAAGTDPNP